MSRIGFIGTGHIAAPMVRFLAARGHATAVSERNAEVARTLHDSHGTTVAPNQGVIDSSDIVFLCLRPQIAGEVIDTLAFRPGQRIVSVMAGIPLARLRAACAPATDITVTIPMGFLEHGGCPLPACPDAGPLGDLFAPENPVLPIADEAAFNQHFAIATMIPATLELLATASGWLAEATGNPDLAEAYTSQLVAGHLASIGKDRAGRLAAERDALGSQGTISLQMIDALRSAHVPETLESALHAIGTRLEAQP